MALIRLPLIIPACNTDGSPADLNLVDTYNICPDTWLSGDTVNDEAGAGQEWQYLCAMLELVWRSWNLQCVGLLNTSEGTAGGGTESGSVDFGTPV